MYSVLFWLKKILLTDIWRDVIFYGFYPTIRFLIFFNKSWWSNVLPSYRFYLNVWCLVIVVLFRVSLYNTYPLIVFYLKIVIRLLFNDFEWSFFLLINFGCKVRVKPTPVLLLLSIHGVNGTMELSCTHMSKYIPLYIHTYIHMEVVIWVLLSPIS